MIFWNISVNNAEKQCQNALIDTGNTTSQSQNALTPCDMTLFRSQNALSAAVSIGIIFFNLICMITLIMSTVIYYSF